MKSDTPPAPPQNRQQLLLKIFWQGTGASPRNRGARHIDGDLLQLGL
jgi:hypothetical protein